ncbi:NAD(P)-binding domain-containing protein [Myxococcota bacterium]|nr:NAD(P)-binding domain-containing protein [Myxococcota bacterium]
MEALPLELSIPLAVLAVLVLGFVAYAVKRSKRERRDTAALARAVATETDQPASLHPVIDPNICIGSLSCVKACPEGDILGIVDNAGALISGASCIGHGRCAVECPVDAIQLVFGTSKRGVDLPEVDDVFESSRPGVHIVGELGGMGLIKNAMTQGMQAGEYLASVLRGDGAAHPTGPQSHYDVLIVGAGASGLATALACRDGGLSTALLEQDSLGGVVAHYPRQKIVMTETVKLPLYGKFGKRYMSKEELLAGFSDIIEKSGIQVTTGVKVTEVHGEDGDFLVRTDKGDYRARKVVLAIGRRGTPRKIGATGEDLPKVTYRLVDPEQYKGARVLVAGGGDSALEAVASLAEAGARATIAYRGPNFVRSRMENQERVRALIAQGKVAGLFNTTVAEIHPDHVVLDTPEGQKVLGNDYVIAALGGELPLEFLKKAGVDVTRHFGKAPAKAHRKEAAPDAKAAARGEESSRRRLAVLLTIVGALIITYLAIEGWDYYVLGARERIHHPRHDALRSSGPWGHGVGLVATLFMLTNFVYAARKRLWIFKGASHIRTWLTWHMFVGFMSPLVIAFHAAFQSKNFLATSTSISLLVVVLTGAVGRYIYGLVPSAQGKAVELGELRTRWERLRAAVVAANPEQTLVGVINQAALTDPPKGGSLFGHLFRMPFESLRFRVALARVGRLEGRHAEIAEMLQEARLLRTQIGFYRSLRQLLSWWRIFHVVLALFLVVAIGVHVGVSIYLGYGWGWGG